MDKFISFIKDAIQSNKQYNAERDKFLKVLQAQEKEEQAEKRLQQILERHTTHNSDR